MVILGLARQGKALARFAAEVGAQVVVSDLRPPEQLQSGLDELADLSLDYVLGEHPMNLLERTDVLAVSGGVPADAPLVAVARARAIRLTNDSLEFMARAPAAVVGVTGSAGKTTTTALTALMGQLAGRQTWVGGNIGRPLIADLAKMQPGDLVVQELSSFQLEIWGHSLAGWPCPQVSAVLNVTPNHLDRHQTMSAYASAKANILRFQTAGDVAVLSYDDPGSRALQSLVRGRLRWFSLERPVEDGAFLHDDQLWISRGRDDREKLCDLADVRLRGRHNVLNVLAAATLADSAGLPVAAIRQAITTFTGVEHRLELVATAGGVHYVNDSIATAPERAIAALESFDEPIILLAGGRDKNLEWAAWATAVTRRVKAVVLFGELADRLHAQLKEAVVADAAPAIVQTGALDEAVITAATLAAPGDVVLLSPGGTSFDAFADFAARGDHFRRLVARLRA